MGPMIFILCYGSMPYSNQGDSLHRLLHEKPKEYIEQMSSKYSVKTDPALIDLFRKMTLDDPK